MDLLRTQLPAYTRRKDVEGIVWQSLDNTTGWTPNNMTTFELDAARGRAGDAGIRVVPSTDTSGYIERVLTDNFSRVTRLTSWVYVPDYDARPYSANLFLRPGTSWSHYYSVRHVQPAPFRQGWNQLRFRIADAIPVGSPDWNNDLTRMRMYVGRRSGVAAEVTFGGVYIDPYSRPKCIITFDDGVGSLYDTAFPIMRASGFAGTSYVHIAPIIGPTPHMTLAQHQEMYAAGWDISNHSWSHANLGAEADKGVVEAEIVDAMNQLEAWGFTRRDSHRHYAPAYGASSDLVREVIGENGIISTRGTTAGYENSSPFRPTSPAMLYCNSMSPTTVSLDDAKAMVAFAINNQMAVSMLFHAIVAAPTEETQWHTDRFQGLIDYLHARRHEIDVVSMSQWYEYIEARGLS